MGVIEVKTGNPGTRFFPTSRLCSFRGMCLAAIIILFCFKYFHFITAATTTMTAATTAAIAANTTVTTYFLCDYTF
jgi:hypothetical protein